MSPPAKTKKPMAMTTGVKREWKNVPAMKDRGASIRKSPSAVLAMKTHPRGRPIMIKTRNEMREMTIPVSIYSLPPSTLSQTFVRI